MEMKSSAEWQAAAKVGALQALAHYRRLLQERELVDEETGETDCVVLRRDDAEGLADMLNIMEDHMVRMWDLTQRVMTSRLCEKVRQG